MSRVWLAQAHSDLRVNRNFVSGHGLLKALCELGGWKLAETAL